jgi:hypothetical protein
LTWLQGAILAAVLLSAMEDQLALFLPASSFDECFLMGSPGGLPGKSFKCL